MSKFNDINRRDPLRSLQRKIGWLAIPNLMTIVIGGMAIVWIMDFFISAASGQSILGMLTFNRALIASGQVWRLVTFLFVPPSTGIFFAIIALYFYWLIGSSLEREWGAFGFTLFYLLGAVGAIISGLITGYATNSYLNMSLFLAFALLNPDYTVLVFFILPVKMKWLALIDGIGLLLSFITESWSGKLGLVFALINLLIFFAPQLVERIKQLWRRWKWKQNFK